MKRQTIGLVPLLSLLMSGCGPATAALVVPEGMIDPNDHDGDAYQPPADCDDENSAIHPDATDVPGDGVDQDCDGDDAEPPLETAHTGATLLETGDTGIVTEPVETGDTSEPVIETGDTGLIDTGIPMETGDTGVLIGDTGDTGITPPLDTGDTGSTGDTGVYLGQLCVEVTAPVVGIVDIYVNETFIGNTTFWVNPTAVPVIPNSVPFASGDAASLVCGDMSQVPYSPGSGLLVLVVYNDGVERSAVTGNAAIGYTSYVQSISLSGAALPCVSFSDLAAAPYPYKSCTL